MTKGIPFNPSLKQLLLVAGLAGSGKSTLINQLKLGTLAPEIRTELPTSAADWPIVTGKPPGRFARALSRRTGPPSGQILHCDFTRAFFTNVVSAHSRVYSEEDAIFRQQLAAPDQIFAVLVTTSREQLMQQVATRSILLHLPPVARSLAARYVPQMVRFESALPKGLTADIVSRLGPRWRQRRKLRDAHSNLLGQYARAKDLESMYRQWERWLTSECSKPLKFLKVEPEPGTAGNRRFHLVGLRDG